MKQASSEPVAYGRFGDQFVDILARLLNGKRVLEVFAGNGLLASKLTARGIDVIATSLFAGHDGHHLGMYHDVIEMNAVEAVETYRDQCDVLMMSWPTTTLAATLAAVRWGPDKDIIFIGEVSDLDKKHFGGCATDEFFAYTTIASDIPGYDTQNFMERAVVMRLRDDLPPISQRMARDASWPRR